MSNATAGTKVRRCSASHSPRSHSLLLFAMPHTMTSEAPVERAPRRRGWVAPASTVACRSPGTQGITYHNSDYIVVTRASYSPPPLSLYHST